MSSPESWHIIDAGVDRVLRVLTHRPARSRKRIVWNRDFTEVLMWLDLWWLYVVGGVVLAFVIFQAWDTRDKAARFTHQERARVDRQAAKYAEGTEYAKQRRSSLKP